MIAMRYLIPLCLAVAVVGLCRADDTATSREGLHDGDEALHVTWAELRNARWPGEPAREDEFGPAVDGVRLAARALPIHDPDAQRVAVAVTVWNDNDGPMSFYGFGWSAGLLPHGRAPQSQTRSIGSPRPTWYGTLTMEPQEKMSYVVAAHIDGAARLTAQQIVKLRFHLVPGLTRWAPGAVISQGHLESAPITCNWPEQMSAELAKAIPLLKKALENDQAATNTFLQHPQAVAACEWAFTERETSTRDLVSFIIRNPTLAAEHVMLDTLCRGGPWTWARNVPNHWAWQMAELESTIPGVVTDTRADLALALTELSVDLTRRRNLEGPANDTYSAILAWNHMWDAAIAAQRWAMERNKGDEDSQQEMAYRLAILLANAAMPPEQAPGPFASSGIVGDAARDALITALADEDPLLSEQSARLLLEQFAGDEIVQAAIANQHQRRDSDSGVSDVSDF